MALWSLVLPFPPFTSHPSVPSNGVSEMLTANLSPRGTDPFSFFTIHSCSRENTGAAQLSCARIGIFGHLSRKAAAFPACSCPHTGSKPSISLPTASMACQIHALPLPSDALLLFHLSTHPPVRFQCHQPQPGLKTDKLSSYFSCLPSP